MSNIINNNYKQVQFIQSNLGVTNNPNYHIGLDNLSSLEQNKLIQQVDKQYTVCSFTLGTSFSHFSALYAHFTKKS